MNRKAEGGGHVSGRNKWMEIRENRGKRDGGLGDKNGSEETERGRKGYISVKRGKIV